MVDCARLLIVDIIKRILIARTTTCVSHSSIVHLNLHQNLSLTLLRRIIISLQNILRFSKIGPLLIVFFHCIRSKSLMIIHHSLSRIFFLSIQIVVSLNNNILTLSSNKNFCWNSRIKFPSITFELISLRILIIVSHIGRIISIVTITT